MTPYEKKLQALWESEERVHDRAYFIEDVLVRLIDQVTEEQWNTALEHAVEFDALRQRQRAICWSTDEELGS